MADRIVQIEDGKIWNFIYYDLLSAFMLFCVFTIGMAFLESSRLQNTRLNGAEYDIVTMNGFTSEQLKMKQDTIGTVSYEMHYGGRDIGASLIVSQDYLESLTSQAIYENMKTIQESQGNMMEIGTIIALLFLLVLFTQGNDYCI